MTFCFAARVAEGIVAIADTRITSGTARTTARKVLVHQRQSHAMFLMTSGLRSVRDKAVTYFEEEFVPHDPGFDRLYKAVNLFSDQLRRVASEDGEPLSKAGLQLNLHALIGGQFEHDNEPQLFLVYPEGNWVEVARATPYFVIGETGYGKPLLDRTLRYDSSLADALKIGFLAFDATRTSCTDVGYPIDVVVCRAGTSSIVEHRYERDSLSEVAEWWQSRIRSAVDELPSSWVHSVLDKRDSTVVPLERPASS